MADVAVGVSACLLGEAVRFDGGHKRSALLCDQLGHGNAATGLFRYVALCPEVAIGLGVPRPPIRLLGNSSDHRAVGVRDPNMDVTARLRDYADQVTQAHVGQLCGYLLMKNSPSCGMARVKVYSATGQPNGSAAGVYAARLMATSPWLPVEESGRMLDPALRECFVTRVLTLAHWRAVQNKGLTAQRLIAFHSCYKFLLMAHSVAAYRAAGRLLADLRGDLDALADVYFSLLMQGLARPASARGHANAMQHLQGYLPDTLEPLSRRALSDSIAAYQRREVPLVVPMSLLRHLLSRFPDDYALAQVYLDPHPARLGLRNEI